MSIKIVDGKLVGSNPHDIERFLIDYAGDIHPILNFRLAECRCGSTLFLLQPDNQKLIKCLLCGTHELIGDDQEYSSEAQIESFICDSCNSEEVSIGIGCSSWDEENDTRQLYLGIRCPRCGKLECFSSWESRLFPLAAFDCILWLA